MKTVEFHDIHRAYQRGQDVLRGVSFDVERGQAKRLRSWEQMHADAVDYKSAER